MQRFGRTSVVAARRSTMLAGNWTNGTSERLTAGNIANRAGTIGKCWLGAIALLPNRISRRPVTPRAVNVARSSLDGILIQSIDLGTHQIGPRVRPAALMVRAFDPYDTYARPIRQMCKKGVEHFWGDPIIVLAHEMDLRYALQPRRNVGWVQGAAQRRCFLELGRVSVIEVGCYGHQLNHIAPPRGDIRSFPWTVCTGRHRLCCRRARISGNLLCHARHASGAGSFDMLAMDQRSIFLARAFGADSFDMLAMDQRAIFLARASGANSFDMLAMDRRWFFLARRLARLRCLAGVPGIHDGHGMGGHRGIRRDALRFFVKEREERSHDCTCGDNRLIAAQAPATG